MINNDEIIFSYTRKEAIDDGILKDVTKLAKEAGVKYPTAVTVKLWSKYINPSEEMTNQGQSEDGRLWDLLTMFCLTAKRSDKLDILYFKVLFQMESEKEPELIKIKAQCHPGDNLEPVITFMLPEED